jgi:hypothetical protein
LLNDVPIDAETKGFHCVLRIGSGSQFAHRTENLLA